MIDLEDNERPPELAEFFDKPIYRAWRIGAGLALYFEGGRFILFEPCKNLLPGSGMPPMLSIQTGSEIPGSQVVENLDRELGQNEHLEALRGLKFTAIDSDVLVLDQNKGVQINESGVRCVRWLDADASV